MKQTSLHKTIRHDDEMHKQITTQTNKQKVETETPTTTSTKITVKQGQLEHKEFNRITTDNKMTTNPTRLKATINKNKQK